MSVFTAVLFSCAEKEQLEPDSGNSFKLMISLDKNISVFTGETVSFRFYSGKGPVKGDKAVLRHAGSGEEIICDITSITSDTFSIIIPDELTTGDYTFLIKRKEVLQAVGKISIEVRHQIKVPVREGYNLYGLVTCDGAGVKDVLLSDGVDFVRTDEEGRYYMKSDESVKVLFIVQPSGYELECEGVLPKMYRYLDGNKATTERTDFELKKVDNENHIMYFIGDLHLARRVSDLAQFSGTFAKDFNHKVMANKGTPQYAITLGDLTWDLYWYQNSYDLYNYVQTVNAELSGIPVYNTIGNHDHDMKYSGDFETVEAYKKNIGPTYYSFNIGSIHYVVLDNILCENTGAGDSDSRHYSYAITQEQFNWLKKDLSYVDKSTPIVMTMHAQLYKEGGAPISASTNTLESVLQGYKVDIYTGHTHRTYNNDFTATKKLFHHNSGAVCATWWWTGYYEAGNGICKDGTPSGYYEVHVNGGDCRWRYKAVGKSDGYQFRTYDGNRIQLKAGTYAPGANTSKAAAFEISAGAWSKADNDNKVYFNIWAYDPAWKIEVREKETGKLLPYRLVKVKDPLHLISYEAKRYNENKEPTGDFRANVIQDHMFCVTASTATSTLEFKITDRFGNVSKETMTRPKDFSIRTYLKEN